MGEGVKTDSPYALESDAYNERSLHTSVRAIALSQGQFALILMRCNYSFLRSRAIAQLETLCRDDPQIPDKPLESLVLPNTVTTLYTTIAEFLGDRKPLGLMILGLESAIALESLLISTNQMREEFRKNFPFPLILWVNEDLLATAIRFAPDFKSWAATSIKFELSSAELLAFLRGETRDRLGKILQIGGADFGRNWTIARPIEAIARGEVEFALKDLEWRGIDLETDLRAQVEFLRGFDDFCQDRLDTAEIAYQKSLAICEAGERPSENYREGDRGLSPPGTPECHGTVLFYLGLLYARRAELVRGTSPEENRVRERQHWESARDYFQEALSVFHEAERFDLVAQYLTPLGQVLRELEAWDELEQLAQYALDLHANDPVQLARDYGFLAQVARVRGDWELCRLQAASAIDTLAPVAEAIGSERGLYFFLLGQALQKSPISGDSNALVRFFRIRQAEALRHLKLARQVSVPSEDPGLHVEILNELRSLYFQRGEYLQAFRIKQEQRAIETLYGFRAFIGAGQLQPSQTGTAGGYRPSWASLQGNEFRFPSQEIAAAGRQQDVERLCERMSRADRKLTILYGQSGVGKSSLVKAGLVPALEQRPVGDRLALTAIVSAYLDWVGTLARTLGEAFGREGSAGDRSGSEEGALAIAASTGEPVATAQAIVRQLRENAERNLLTILIFDQFEEFFFAIKSRETREQFYDFLKTALDVPFVKVILSLRIDFLHYLLELERSRKFDIVNNDILNKEIRYYLGDFSRQKATEVFESLSGRSQFYLEPELIDALVNDLADDTGEVRPIELQLVGAQLQDDKITTLKAYRQLGSAPKSTLIERSLVQVVRDCGPQNERIAWEILYNLTDRKNTRPLKTKQELLQVCSGEIVGEAAPGEERLNLILEILVGSGLVFLHHEEPAERYQLVHDYLVNPVRQKYEKDFGVQASLAKALEEEKKQSQVKLEQSNQKLKQQRQGLMVLAVGLAIVSLFAVRNWQQAEVQKRFLEVQKERAQIIAMSAANEALFVLNREFDALMESLRAWGEFKQAKQPDVETKMRVATALQQAVYGVRERNRLEGHGAEVWSVSYSPRGDLIASAGNDGEIRVWKPDGSLHLLLPGHLEALTSVSFSPDGKTIASASRDRTVKLWNAEDGRLLAILDGHDDSVYCVTFSPDGELVATASHDRTIKLWRRSDGQLVKTIRGHDGPVTWVTFSPDGQLIASASDDKTVKVWRRNGKLMTTLPPHNDWAIAVAFSKDGKSIVSAGIDKMIRVWHLDGRPPRIWKAHEGEIFSLAFVPNSNLFASSSDDNTIKLWELDGTLVRTLKGHSGRVTSVSFAPDGETLASGSFDKTVRLWRYRRSLLTVLKGHDSRVSSVSFAPDGETIASASWDNTAKLWDRQGNLLTTLNEAQGHQKRVFGVSFSPNGESIATASQDCTVKVWNRQGELLTTLVDPKLERVEVSLSPVTSMEDEGNEDCNGASSHGDRVYAVSFSPDGQTIASGSRDRTVKLWGVDGSLLATLEGHGDRVNSVSFSPNGRYLASGSDDKTIKLWDTRQKKLVRTFSGIAGHDSYVTDVSFSPDGKTIASASWDNTVKLWPLEGGEPRTLLQGYSDSVESVSFSPNGEILASASWDTTVKLWSLNNGNLIKTLQGHTSGVLDVAFSPAGKMAIASAGADNHIIVWNLDLDDLVIRACSWLNDYLEHSTNISEEDRNLCEGIPIREIP